MVLVYYLLKLNMLFPSEEDQTIALMMNIDYGLEPEWSHIRR
jgi:hypothetical protein